MTVQYFEIPASELKEGQFFDRSIFIYLSENNRYIQVAHPLDIIDGRILAYASKLGKLYSREDRLENRYPELDQFKEIFKRVVSRSDARSNVEKAIALHAVLEWLERCQNDSLWFVFFNQAIGLISESLAIELKKNLATQFLSFMDAMVECCKRCVQEERFDQNEIALLISRSREKFLKNQVISVQGAIAA